VSTCTPCSSGWHNGCIGWTAATIDDLLRIPLAPSTDWRPTTSRRSSTTTQGILGYVVRWVDQGIGCSKVPDIRDIGLMEDRATSDLVAAHRQLVAARWRDPRRRDSDDAADGGGRRSAERRRSCIHTHGLTFDGAAFGLRATWCSPVSSSRPATPNRSCMPVDSK
jgi:hypothetical protein